MARSSGSIIHVNAVRLRTEGVGNLKTSISSYSGVRNQNLIDTVLQDPTDRMPTRLANFKGQGIQVMIYTAAINEWFVIGEIIAFIKPVSTGYPG